MINNTQDTIVALATPAGQGAIGVIRLSGSEAIPIIKEVFSGKDPSKVHSHTVNFGTIRDDNNNIIDEVLVSIFKSPRSYTMEDVVEISTHGSSYIIQQILQLLCSKGARLADPGEFTQRAFLNGRFDLTQAEAVADLIASENAAMQQTAINQMRGGFSSEIQELRKQLIHFVAMIELELDFAEEDVEFANREGLKNLMDVLHERIDTLIESFRYGNALKNGIPLVIAGKPNAGKSTLLNALLNEEKAIVTPIPGTTRDFIEDEITLKGIKFRLTDTAGLRETSDAIEAIGVSRSKEKMEQAALVIYLLDLTSENTESITSQKDELKKSAIPFLLVGNKSDQKHLTEDRDLLLISAKEKHNLDTLIDAVFKKLKLDSFNPDQVIVTNSRHHQELLKTKEALQKSEEGLEANLPNDLLAFELRTALKHLGNITGEIEVDRDILGTIFSKFCIGK